MALGLPWCLLHLGYWFHRCVTQDKNRSGHVALSKNDKSKNDESEHAVLSKNKESEHIVPSRNWNEPVALIKHGNEHAVLSKSNKSEHVALNKNGNEHVALSKQNVRDGRRKIANASNATRSDARDSRKPLSNGRIDVRHFSRGDNRRRCFLCHRCYLAVRSGVGRTWSC